MTRTYGLILLALGFSASAIEACFFRCHRYASYAPVHEAPVETERTGPNSVISITEFDQNSMAYTSFSSGTLTQALSAKSDVIVNASVQSNTPYSANDFYLTHMQILTRSTTEKHPARNHRHISVIKPSAVIQHPKVKDYAYSYTVQFTIPANQTPPALQPGQTYEVWVYRMSDFTQPSPVEFNTSGR